MKQALTIFAVALPVLVACAQRNASAPTPAPAPAPPVVRYGPLMVAIGRHHEMLGRAIVAGRWELAAYALRELDEEFEPLAGAEQPEEAQAPLRPIAASFAQTQLAPIEAAVRTRDGAAARAAWAAVSMACNGCHTTAGFGFLVVPAEAGAPVPEITPASLADAASVADASADASPPRLPAMNERCEPRAGCADGLLCCTHSGVSLGNGREGRCMTRQMCSTQP